MDLIAEPLLDHRGRRLAGPEPGQPRLPRVALCDSINLGVDGVARDLDRQGLLSVGDVLEFCFHEGFRLRASGSRPGSAKGGTRTHTPFRVPDPKSGASASSATFASRAAYSGIPTSKRGLSPGDS